MMREKRGKVVSVNHPIVQNKINKSLKLRIREGALASVSNGFGMSYLSPFALLLNATASQMGILFAITSLLPSLVQLKTSKLIQKFSRKRIALIGTMGRVLFWIPIILVGFLFYIGVSYMVWMLIGVIAILYAFAGIVNPAWFSWMGLLVPEKTRGNYFSKRNRFVGFFGVSTMIIAALILDSSKKVGGYYGNILGFTLLGFGLLFLFALITRFWSWNLLRKQYEPRLIPKKKDYFSFKQFLNNGLSTPFGRFTMFRGIFSLVIGIAGPFWTVYMLRDLGFSYIWFMMITVSAILFQLMFLPLLGKFSDKFGNIKLMRVCTWFIIIVPLFWIASVFIENDLAIKLYLLFVPAIIGGFGWAGYNLAVNNYVYDAVVSPKRSFGISYMNLMVGVGIFIGASLGALLAWINISFMNPLLFIFAVSAVGRLIVVIFGLKFLHEVRHVHKFSSEFLVEEFQPVRGAVREIHNLEHLVRRVEHYI